MEPLIKYKRSLQDLKRVATRQVSQLMAVVLDKKLNDIDARFKHCPAGAFMFLRIYAPIGYSALFILGVTSHAFTKMP